MQILNFLIGPLNRFLWQGVVLPLVIVGGVIFTVRSGFFQFRFGKRMLRETLGNLFRGTSKTEGTVTPFQALTTALAGTMGVGSIVGSCHALVVGGIGAVFWMWIAAFLGMILKLFEVVLALRYRRKNEIGEWVGGPMYYLLFGLKKKGLAVLFAVFAVFASLGMGNLAQSGSISDAVLRVVEGFCSPHEKSISMISGFIGLILAFCLAFSVFGGANRLGKVTSFLVPPATLLFLMLSFAVIFCDWEKILPTFWLIIKRAFAPRAALGGASGVTMMAAMRWGFCRSAFSNEAGLGSAAIAHAQADSDHPVRQGFFGMFEVFADTLVVSSITAFTVIIALGEEGIASLPSEGSSLLFFAFSTLYGEKISSLIVGFGMVFFAFSTLLGWSLYGLRCIEFLFGKAMGKIYLVIFVIASFFGAVLPMKIIWGISDVFNALMAIPNFIALFGLAPQVLVLIDDFRKKYSNYQKKKIVDKNCLTEK